VLEIEQAVWDAFADAAAARERGEQLLLVAFRAGVPVKRLVALSGLSKSTVYRILSGS
jgi:hypothetical protein